MHRNQSVSTHQFAMVPRADIPRSSFRIQKAHKTTFDAGYLVPIYVDEILPGDTFSLKATMFARLATPIFPIMDNLYLDQFWFFVPSRLVWSNWKKFMGEQTNPGDSTSYTVPQVVSPAGGFAANSIFDYMGLPTAGQVTAGKTVSVNALPLRAYNLIYNEWFRDENLVNSQPNNQGDGPDTYTNYVLMRRGKRHDYFTSCLPWVQKGTAVSLPLGTSAPVLSSGTTGPTFKELGGTNRGQIFAPAASGNPLYSNVSGTLGALTWNSPGLYADLSAATAATINQIRQAFQIQKLLERDARGGTRYTELVRSHFGVISPDARLQRPELLGTSSQPVNISEIAQTAQTGLTGGTTPLGSLAATGRVVAHGGWSQSFTEHGYVIGIASVRADLNYQQGLRKMWQRSTRYDFYWPVFAALGEQAVLNSEIYVTGDVTDSAVFGYQERWAEYRYNPSQITGLFRSTYVTPLDAWHLAQKFTGVPTLNQTFIEENPPVSRVVAVGAAANGAQFIFDSFFDIRAARPMPLYSVPGLVDHF